MIPKIIHYCWFGRNPLSSDAIKCIQSWKKYFPDYEIIEWNESNFNIHSCSYIEEAYQCKKWAFVSDFARFKILYENGGLYFDTDVEVIKSFEPIIVNGQFMGKEANNDSLDYYVNPGLGMAAEEGDILCREVIDYYSSIHFDESNIITICEHVTNLLKEKGYIGNNQTEKVAGYVLYPQEYLCPKNYYNGELNITSNTYSIHHYSNTWSSDRANKFHDFEIELIGLFGNKILNCILLKVIKNIYCFGLIKTISKIRKK